MVKRFLVVAAVTAGLSAPGGVASADSASTRCVPVPVNTVGAHVVVGDRQVHVPALSNARICVGGFDAMSQTPPVRFTLHPDCGFPCFALVVERGDWTVVSTRVMVFLTYDSDGVPTYHPLVDLPIWVEAYNPNPACLAVGNPIPDCPAGSVVVPVPMP